MAPQLSKLQIQNLVNEEVLDFSVKTGSKAGDNVAGDIYAIKVNTVSGKILDLVFKIPPENNADLREYVIDFKVFQMEITVYTKLKESIHKFLESRGISEEEFSVPIPTYFGGLCDGQNDFLCLEDMRPFGFLMPNKYTGLNLPEVLLVMTELAKFHALTYSVIKHEGEQYFDKVEGMAQIAHNFFTESSPMIDAALDVMFGGGLEVAKTLLNKRNPVLAEKLNTAIGNSDVLPLMKHTGGLTDTKLFPVIIHGDFWTNNILIKYDDSGKPIKVNFIDFQQCHRGNIMEELVYFFIASTTPAFRDKYLLQALNVYYKSFTSAIVRLKIPGPQNFTIGVFLDIFFNSLKSGLVISTYAVPLQLGVDPEVSGTADEGDPREAMKRRLTRMLEGSPIAFDRLESIVKEFGDLGII